jgi:hypothetical protein
MPGIDRRMRRIHSRKSWQRRTQKRDQYDTNPNDPSRASRILVPQVSILRPGFWRGMTAIHQNELRFGFATVPPMHATLKNSLQPRQC